MTGLGTLINTASIAAGGLIGHFAGKIFRPEQQDSICRACGVSVMFIAVAGAMGLSMLRALTGLSILWFVVPGYLISLALSFFVPGTFTAIAFDSGGVASGPLTAAFMLPFAMGAVDTMGGNVMTDAFGLVALVAMMPLITVQIMGIISVLSSRRAAGKPLAASYAENDIIELWEM